MASERAMTGHSQECRKNLIVLLVLTGLSLQKNQSIVGERLAISLRSTLFRSVCCIEMTTSFIQTIMPAPFEFQGQLWRSAQHAYHASKFDRGCEVGQAIRAEIMAAATAREAKEIGTLVLEGAPLAAAFETQLLGCKH